MKDANDEIGDFLRDQATEGLEEVDDELAELEAELAEEAMKDMEFPDARKESKKFCFCCFKCSENICF